MYYAKERQSGMYLVFNIYNLMCLNPLNIIFNISYTDEEKTRTMFEYATDAIETLSKTRKLDGVYDVICADTCKVMFTLYKD